MRHRVGIRELRDSLSRWIERVRRGDTVVVTDHGKDVAVLRPASGPARARTVEEHLDGLAELGLLRRGRGWRPMRPLRLPGLDLARQVLDDREDRA